jgi:hypothetical protein
VEENVSRIHKEMRNGLKSMEKMLLNLTALLTPKKPKLVQPVPERDFKLKMPAEILDELFAINNKLTKPDHDYKREFVS